MKSFASLEINFKKNLDHVYIFKLPITDISQLKVM